MIIKKKIKQYLDLILEIKKFKYDFDPNIYYLAKEEKLHSSSIPEIYVYANTKGNLKFSGRVIYNKHFKPGRILTGNNNITVVEIIELKRHAN